MKINVVEPNSWMLTHIFDAQKQLALCAYGAGLSRGRHKDRYLLDRGISVQGIPDLSDPAVREHKNFSDAEELLKKLMNYKPHPHESVIEHGNVSFLFQCSRIATHEIVRHRLCAFTQTSTRYIEEKDEITFIKPPHMPEGDLGDYVPGLTGPDWVQAAANSIAEYQTLRDQDIKRESARYLLPHCLSCWIQITANFRQWRHMIRLRTSKKAAPEMQRLFNQVKDDLTKISPVLTEDL